MTVSAAAVWDAMDGVIDPELDRSLVELEFVRSVEVGEDDVHVALRLPTYWCSPNFAYLMVGDAQEAVRRVPGAERVRIDLVDHYAGERISAAIEAGLSFQEAFPDQAEGGLDDLRRKFRLKAFVVRQEPVRRSVRRTLGDVAAVALRIGDGTPPEGVEAQEWSEYMRRRRVLDMGEASRERVFTDSQGAPLPPDGLNDYLRLARSVRISLMSNTEFCTGLLAARYDGLGGAESLQQREVTA